MNRNRNIIPDEYSPSERQWFHHPPTRSWANGDEPPRDMRPFRSGHRDDTEPFGPEDYARQRGGWRGFAADDADERPSMGGIRDSHQHGDLRVRALMREEERQRRAHGEPVRGYDPRFAGGDDRYDDDRYYRDGHYRDDDRTTRELESRPGDTNIRRWRTDIPRAADRARFGRDSRGLYGQHDRFGREARDRFARYDHERSSNDDRMSFGRDLARDERYAQASMDDRYGHPSTRGNHLDYDQQFVSRSDVDDEVAARTIGRDHDQDRAFVPYDEYGRRR